MSRALTPNDWHHLEPLLDAVLDAAPERRAAVLVELCDGDPAQRAMLERLVAECERDRRLLDEPAVERFPGLLHEETPNLPDMLADRYRVTRELGQGGMATVYLARDLKHDRDVAVKVLHPDVAAVVGADRFEREIHLAAQLTHPHILPLFDSGDVVVDRDAARRLWYTMPYIAGESLRSRLVRERQLPVAEAVRIATEVADALDYAHRQGFIHRDIKPENILLHDGHALVADFGIARAIDPTDGRQVTEAGVLLGTPAYMSPEQASGSRALDARTDVYSLGCVLYEMLAGTPPYTGTTAVEIVAQVVSADPPRVGLTRPSAELLDPLLARTMARLPADRFATARELADALAGSSSVETSGPRGAPAAGTERTSVTSARTPERPLRRWSRYAPWYGMAAIALGALVVLRPGRSPAERIPRIAVLPLRNLTGDPRNDPLAEAMTEELISMLGREPDKLRAIPSTSVSRFRDRQTDLRAIAETLGVPNVVEGTLTRLDDRMRLILRLVDGRDHSSRWAGTYDGETRDILAEPPRIAREVARQLGARLSGALGASLLTSGAHGDRVPDGRMAAADLYVRGRSGELFRTAAGRQQAMSFFRGAIVADSTFAPAHAAIAAMLTMQDRYIAGTRREQLALARTFARRAIGLDSTLASAQFALGRVLMAEHQFAKAEAQFKRAIDLDPMQIEYREYLAQLYVFMDRPRDALIEAERAVDAAPYSPNATAELARAWLVNGDCDKALEIGDQLERMQPPPARAAFITAQCYARRRMWQKAIDVMRPVAAANPREAGPVLGFVLAQAGQTREASAMRDTLLAEARRGAVGAYSVAILYAGLRDFDNAFEWLDKSIDDRSLRFQIMEPGFEALHRDARFASLRAKLGIRTR